MNETTALLNIGSLVTNDPTLGDGMLGLIPDAAVVIEDGRIAWVGPSSDAPAASAAIDLEGRAVLPGFVDSHAHLLFAGDRAAEFAARMSGQPYSAGGIRSTVTATRGATDDQLAENLHRLAAELRRSGVTTFETKSGYGLTTVDESRALRIARDVTGDTTYLGAHVVPAEFEGRPDDYVALVAGGMLEACAPHAKWIDVFCDRGAFDVDQARTILLAGMAAGLAPRLHANQLQHGGGVQLAVELDAASADHCTHLDDRDIEALAGSNTVATLLPGAEFSTRSPYPDARRLLDAGATIALATDCNPGSSYTTSMSLMIALAVRDMSMTPDEAVWSATLGGAQALRRNDIGRISIGSRADLISLNAPSHVHIAYRPGVDLIDRVWQAPLTPKVAA
ncbi:MAG: imidazolonepropionase [Actinobacteria bacterium]|uniref:imidazolonepropionase n=1 Tax=freshwater metagenome TaxID=449393 RepID=A0A6J7QVU9_9ZZZZ|nr:imidazolonepropionase [Actinomycetota bacterium]